MAKWYDEYLMDEAIVNENLARIFEGFIWCLIVVKNEG